jgi:hypothetical protein
LREPKISRAGLRGDELALVGGNEQLEFVLQFAEIGHEYAGRIRFVAGVTVEDEELEVEDVLAPEELWF